VPEHFRFPDVGQLLTLFPEFDDPIRFPETAIQGWLDMSTFFLNPLWWPNWRRAANGLTMMGYAACLFAAHNLVLGLQSVQRSSFGGPPGAQVGVFSATSANGASVSYDTSVGIAEGAAQWNLSNYGIRFIQLARLVGNRPVQLGSGQFPVGQGGIPTSGPAWPGALVIYTPGQDSPA
jgi:hypothetical protein